MPKVDYATALDYFVILCFVQVFGTIAEYAAILFYERRVKRRRLLLEEKKKALEEQAKAEEERKNNMVGAPGHINSGSLPLTEFLTVFFRNARCDYRAVHDYTRIRRPLRLAICLLRHRPGLLRHTVLCLRVRGGAGVCLYQLRGEGGQQATQEAGGSETPDLRAHNGVCVLL